MLNRSAITLRYREPAIRWINEADPSGEGPEITPEIVAEDRTVYLIPDEETTGDDAGKTWLERNFDYLFEVELESWYTAESLWPKNRSLALFREWFEMEYHSGVEDTVDGALTDDG